MKIFFAIVLGLAILALVNVGLMEVGNLLELPLLQPHFLGINGVFSFLLLFWFARLLWKDADESARQDAFDDAFEAALDKAKQEAKDDDVYGDDTNTDLPMFTDEDSPREYRFGTIDLVFRGATAAEAAIMAIQFISHKIFEGAKPEHRGPSPFGRPVNESSVRVVYRRVNESELARSDASEQRKIIEAAYSAMRLKLPDGRVWKITDNNHITWIPYNKFMYDVTILLDPAPGEPRKYHS